MKFARYLEENVVVEWRKAYINYRGLKKLIKRVDARYKERTSLELSKQHSIQSNPSLRSISAAVDGLRKRQRKGSSTSGGEASDSPIWCPNDREQNHSNFNNNQSTSRPARVEFEDELDRHDRFPRVSLDGTGLSIDSDISTLSDHGAQPYYPDADDANTNVPVLNQHSHSKVSSRGVNGESSDVKGRPSMKAGKSDNSLFDRLRQNNEESGIGFGDVEDNVPPKKRSKRARRKAKGEAELTEVINTTFDEQERLFFKALDSELARIVKFYTAREEDMSKRYAMIARQLEELADHRREYKATHQTGNEWTDLGHRFSHLVAPISQPAQTFKRASMQIRRNESPSRAASGGAGKTTTKTTGIDDKQQSTTPAATQTDPHTTSVDEGDKRRVVALTKMLNVYGGTLSELEDEELRKANRLAAYSHDPERYKAARKKLKTAVLEYYRGLEILKNYKILNRTGFAKILKKFEKTTQVHCADAYYHSKVASSVLVSSEVVEKLIKGTEEIFTAYFEHGNRKRALERLRVHTNSASEQHTSTHHLSTARTGMYLGITLCATIAGLVSAMHPKTKEEIPLWDQLMRVYGAEFLPTFFALLFGINLAVWHHARVNAVFIFEWDVRHVLDFHQFFELPAFFLLLLSIAFWVSFLNPFPQSIAPTTWPLVWLVVVLVVMLNPLPIGYYHARKWLIVSLGRVFHGGILSRVEFRDFFLGDELNSLNWSISMLWFIGCQYNHKWAYPNQCDPNSTFWTAVLLAVPAFLRFTQCLRRWFDSNYTARLHLVNAGKYASSMFHYFLYINYRYHGSKPGKELAVWCVFASIYSIYTSSWDIIMDWSLLQPKARYPFLRNELVYEQYWPFYYWAMLTDIVLRFSWSFYLAPGPAGSLTRIFIIAMLEMLRRWQWNFLRLENEHLGNVDMYRVSREVPLPYHVQRSDLNTDDEEDGDKATKGSKLGKIPAIASERMKKFVHLLDHNKAKAPHDEEWGEENAIHSSASSSSQNRTNANVGVNKGKQATSDTTSEGESHDWAANEDTLVTHKGRSGSSSLAARIRESLVPDKGGIEPGKAGTDLSKIGGAHGEAGRDYVPRKSEPAIEASDESDEE